MALIDSSIELSKEHQPAGKTTPQCDKDHTSVSSSDLFPVLRVGQILGWNSLFAGSFMLFHLFRWLEVQLSI